ncbi:hypothetical protein [Prevotella histicola]
MATYHYDFYAVDNRQYLFQRPITFKKVNKYYYLVLLMNNTYNPES